MHWTRAPRHKHADWGRDRRQKLTQMCNHNHWSPSRLNWSFLKRTKVAPCRKRWAPPGYCAREAQLSQRRVRSKQEKPPTCHTSNKLCNYALHLVMLWMSLHTTSISLLFCYYYSVGVKSRCKLHRSAKCAASHFSLSWEKVKIKKMDQD